MEKGVYKYYTELPSWSKGIIVLSGVAIIGFVGYTIYKNAKIKQEEKKGRKAAEEAKKELNELSKQGIIPSFGNSQYEIFVQTLVTSMDSCGTDEAAIYSVFNSMKNKADVLKLVETFGVRYYSPCIATNPISYSKFLFDSKAFGGGISDWLTYDLANSERQNINNILSKKSIDYKF
jgi:hypothetical protein